MHVVHSIVELREVLDDARLRRATVGLVPTMGALHDGHRSLIERAKGECDVVVVTVFVNPLQFSDPDDIDNYPRTLDADVQIATSAGASLVFAPSVAEMYPEWPMAMSTSVSVRGVSDLWEGLSRPGHFDGVATVVAKLFAIVGACRAYFGEKDFQQLAVVRQMTDDLSLPVEVVGVTTVREPDGLALSSRNVRLNPAERQAATALSAALRRGAIAIAEGERNPSVVVDVMSKLVSGEPLVALDYAAVVRAKDLSVPATLDEDGEFRLLIAGKVGPVRLIDNLAGPVARRIADIAEIAEPVGVQ